MTLPPESGGIHPCQTPVSTGLYAPDRFFFGRHMNSDPRSVCLKVIALLEAQREDDTTAGPIISCGDLAILAPHIPVLADWQGWLWRRRNSGLQVQRSPKQRLELLVLLGALADDLQRS